MHACAVSTELSPISLQNVPDSAIKSVCYQNSTILAYFSQTTQTPESLQQNFSLRISNLQHLPMFATATTLQHLWESHLSNFNNTEVTWVKSFPKQKL